jgi:hypothetical protein
LTIIKGAITFKRSIFCPNVVNVVLEYHSAADGWYNDFNAFTPKPLAAS